MADDQKDALEGMMAYLSQVADQLETESGREDSDIRAKIALLKQTIRDRDTVVQETAQRIETGGAFPSPAPAQRIDPADTCAERKSVSTLVSLQILLPLSVCVAVAPTRGLSSWIPTMSCTGVAEMYQHIASMENSVASAEALTADPGVAAFLATTQQVWSGAVVGRGEHGADTPPSEGRESSDAGNPGGIEGQDDEASHVGKGVKNMKL
jgi:hypothetical protein